MMSEERNFFSDNNTKYIGSKNIFLNSNSIFIEYDDIIRNVELLLALILNQTKNTFNGLIDISEIHGLSYESLFEWYINRENRHTIKELLSEDKKLIVPDSTISNLTNDVINLFEMNLDDVIPLLQFASVIRNIRSDIGKLVGKIFIWYPHDNKVIREDIENSFGKKGIEFMYGDIVDCMKEVPRDSSYVFSDITNIDVLYEIDKLSYSSIMVPYEYAYNQIDGNYKINIEEYAKESVFKFDLFSAF